MAEAEQSEAVQDESVQGESAHGEPGQGESGQGESGRGEAAQPDSHTSTKSGSAALARAHAVARGHAGAGELPTILDTDRPAGIVSRVLAAVIDVIVVLAINACLYLGFVVVRLVYEVQDFSLPNHNPFFTAGTFVLMSLIYLTACWSISGRTVGSVVLGLRLVSRKGKPRVRVPVAALRAFICVFFSLGLFWVAVDRRRRSLADLVVRTSVVYSR